jgi:polysaccharide export outer membrane protein
MVAGLAVLAGCDSLNQFNQKFWKTDKYRFLDPSATVRRPDRPLVNPILPSVGLADQTEDVPPNATFPRDPEDYQYSEKDYIIGPTDVLDIGIMDLFQQGAESTLRREVTNAGFIDLPLLPQQFLKAEGLTKDELRDTIINAYRVRDVYNENGEKIGEEGLLRDPTVSVSVAGRRQNVFSILGAITRPGQYTISRKDMRLLEALAIGGGSSQTNIKYLYVIRPTPAVRIPTTQPGLTTRQPTTAPLPPIPTTRPTTTASAPGAGPVTVPGTATSAPARNVEGELKGMEMLTPGPRPPTQPVTPAPIFLPRLTEMADVPASSSTSATAETEMAEPRRDVKWIYTGGRWVPVSTDVATQAAPVPATTSTKAGPDRGKLKLTDPWNWGKLDKSDQARIILINLPKLQNGDPRMNILVRDNDVVYIPTVEVGEFYVMGEVQRPGVYSLTGRRLTVKMAVAAAGNLSPLAWPENALLIRRIGDNEEQAIALNLEAIVRGEEPDVFLKADDVIAVGTHVAAPFLAVMRNAFRLTYGFGFIYDRNFSDPPLAGANSRRFTRW